jgi:hypothetical protein
MSIESLLLLAVLIVLPLLERLISVLRTRARRSPADLARVPAPERRATVPRPRVPEKVPDAFGATHEVVFPVTVVPEARRHGTSRRTGPADLRRAIVLMTILGPCKALEDDGRA